MKKIWTYIDSKSWREKTKYRVMYLLAESACALAGFILWLLIRSHGLSSWDCMLCFIGYPIILSRIAVFLYSGSHDFHDNRYKKQIR